MKSLDCSVVVKVKVTGKVAIPVNVHLDTISSSAEPFVTKLDMMLHNHGQSVMQEDSFAVFNFNVTMRAHTIKHDCFYPYLLNY